MKYLIILFLISLPAFACKNSIPESEAIKAINLEPNAGSKSCTDLPKERCLCYDGIEWGEAEIVDNEVLDFIQKEKVDSCESKIREPATKSECQLKLEALVCEFGKPIMTETEVYCAVEIMKKDGKKLVESETKKAARRAQREAERAEKEAEKADKRAIKEALKGFKCDSGNNVATAKKCTEDAVKAIFKLIKDMRVE